MFKDLKPSFYMNQFGSSASNNKSIYFRIQYLLCNNIRR